MKKIIVIGSSGAGKSTLARKLGAKLGIEVFHLDQLLWKPNWVMSTLDYQIDIQNNVIVKPSWIIDGNFGDTLNMRISAADTIVFLDRSRIVCIYQILKRVRKYNGVSRPDMQSKCPEKFDLNFIKWVWKFPNKQRLDIIKLLQEISDDKQILHLKNKKQIQHFLENV